MADGPDPANAAPLHARASDADRDRVAEVLREAAGDGRLTLDELSVRLDQVYAAKTHGELAPITHDLPAGGIAPARPAPMPGAAARPPARGADETGAAVAVMSGFKRAGRWRVPRRFRAVAFWGGGELDLREAQITHGQTTIRVVAIMGGVQIIVPEDADVEVTGLGIMGGFDHGAAGAGRPDGPRIVVTGLAFWGGVSVRRRPRPADRGPGGQLPG